MPVYPYMDDDMYVEQRKVACDAYVVVERYLYSVPWQYVGKEVWVRDHGPTVEIHCSIKPIRDLRGAQARTLRQSLPLRDLSARDGESHGTNHAKRSAHGSR
jgi:hypothetical protein